MIGTEIARPGEAQGPGAFGRILVMDDEGAMRRLLGKLLSRLGYEASCTSTGEEAIREYSAALEAGQRFDAVILDLSVHGGAGGARTIEALALVDPGVKAIVCSGYSNDPVMHDPEWYGFCAMLAKPYGARQLDRLLREVLGMEAPAATGCVLQSPSPVMV